MVEDIIIVYTADHANPTKVQDREHKMSPNKMDCYEYLVQFGFIMVSLLLRAIIVTQMILANFG